MRWMRNLSPNDSRSPSAFTSSICAVDGSDEAVALAQRVRTRRIACGSLDMAQACAKLAAKVENPKAGRARQSLIVFAVFGHAEMLQLP